MAMLSIWGIILVVMGHSGFTNEIIADKLPNLHKWIYSFHMPLFFFISGYLFSLTNKSLSAINAGQFIIKKLKRLMIPYFVLGIIIFCIKYLFAGFASVERSFNIGSFFYMFIAPSAENSTMGFLWYLITLFGIFCIVLMLAKLRINLRNVVVCTLLVTMVCVLNYIIGNVEAFNLSAIFYYMPFFLLGIYAQSCRIETKVSLLEVNTLTINIIMGGGIQAILIFGETIQLPGEIRILLTGSLGIWLSICLCRLLLLNQSMSKILLPQAPMVYTIYLLSWFGQYPVQIAALNIFHLNWLLSFFLIFAGGIIFPVCVYQLCQKLRRLKFYRIISLTIGL